MRWKARLTRAERREAFCPDDILLAGSWSSCALGERTRDLSLDADTFAWKQAQRRQGNAFFKQVERDQIEQAKATYAAIQQWAGASR